MFKQAIDRKPVVGRVRDPEATRERILECAFDEMYEKGYAGASLDQILSDSGVTKGALYHHFGSKADLAVAVIDEIIRPRFLQLWVDPVKGSDDPIATLIETTRANFSEVDSRFVEWGCPLNNLSQELANSDEKFRTHLNGVFEAGRRP
jgi:TetR/AcrR family transcriptional repressor of nem operon